MLKDLKFTKNSVKIALAMEYFKNLNDLGLIPSKDEKIVFRNRDNWRKETV